MGRPATGPLSSFPIELKEAILHLRTLHPGWGPNTLLAALKTEAYWCNQPLPSRAQIARLLKQAGLTRRYQPHHDLPQPPVNLKAAKEPFNCQFKALRKPS